MTKYDSNFREYLLLNRDSVANMPSPPEREHRGQFFIDRSVGPPDQVAYVRLAADGTSYEKAILYTPTDLLSAESIDPATDLTVNSIVVSGGARLGGSGTPTIITQSSAGDTANLLNVGGGIFHSEFDLVPNGVGISTGAMVKVTFGITLANSNYDVIFPARGPKWPAVSPYLHTRTTTFFIMGFGVAPTAGSTYSGSYIWVGR